MCLFFICKVKNYKKNKVAIENVKSWVYNIISITNLNAIKYMEGKKYGI